MGLKGYTFDRMKISPKADALLYHSMLDGNDRIVKGYKDELKVVATGLNTYISPGACVVQGRLIEVDEEMQLSVSANDSGYVCIVIDLTQNNTSTGEAGTPEYQPTNNQIRLEVVKELVQQDLHNGGQLYTFPLASFTSTGTTVALTKIDYDTHGSNENGEWEKYPDGRLICRQQINLGKPNLGSGTFNDPFRTNTKTWIFPKEMISVSSYRYQFTARVAGDSTASRSCIASVGGTFQNRVESIQASILGNVANNNDIYIYIEIEARWK